MKEYLRRYFMGMPELTAWKRDAILNTIMKEHNKRINSAVLKTIILTNAIIVIFTIMWNLLLE